MASVNRVTLIGNLGRDPEMRYLPSGEAVATFSVATTEQWKDKQGGKQERTDWHRIEFIGRTAEVCGEYLKKGAPVYIEGRLNLDTWDDKATGQKRSKLKVVGEGLQLLGTDSANSLVGTATADSIDARAGNDVVDAGAGDDFVRAGDGGDRVQAGEGHDTVLGGTGNDTLYGGNGADVLVGGPGVDSLVGGPTTRGDGSADLFVFDTTPNTSTNRDYVYGFEATSRDRIVLSPAIFGPLLAGSSAGVDADELRVGRAVQALDGNDHLLFDSQTGQLFFDADGTGPLARMVVAQLVGLVGTLDASDFTLEMPAGV